MKKNISDHLARAFFDRKIEEGREKSFFFFIALSIAAIVTFIFLASFLLRPGKQKGVKVLGQSIALQSYEGPFVLNFDFNGAFSKIESLNIEIPKIDLSNFDVLNFSIRLKNADASSLGALRVSVSNTRNEVSHLYISGIHDSWKRVSMPFSEFKKICDWSNLSQLSFTLEEWNLHPKSGELLIDDIEFSKK